jgi:DNA-binding FadR family transcriptional regulator
MQVKKTSLAGKMQTKKTKSAEVANKLNSMVLSEKTLLPGERLPDERTMATEFGVSRTSIREAVKMLETSGILVIKKALGIFVAENPGISTDPFHMDCFSDKIKVMRDWYEVRLALETEMMRMVVANASDEEIAQIVSLEREVANSIINETDDFLDLDRQFHSLLAKSTHNDVFERVTFSLQQSIYYMIAKTPHEEYSKRIKENALVQHKEIARFLEKRDTVGAMLAMRFHLLLAIEDLNYFPHDVE